MTQFGFFDFDIRLDHINKADDPLVQQNDTVDWEIFRSTLEEARKSRRNRKLVPKGFISFCCLKSLIGILFPGFLAFMLPARFQMQLPSGVSEKI